MDWDDLRYLLAVHRRGSLAKAAAELGVTKATVSRRIAALEDSVGTLLVERRADGMVLTQPGRAAARAAEEMERAGAVLRAALESAAGDQPAGLVRLSAPPWLAERLLIPALPPFRARFPDLDLHIHTSHELVDIAAREADLALRNVQPTRGPLVCQRIGELAGCVYGSHLYLQRRGVPARRDDLRDHDVLVYEGRGGMPGFEWLAEPAWQDRVAFRAGDPVGLMSAAVAGLGLAAIPCVLGETEPSLRRVDALGVGYSPLYLVTHEEIRRTARLRAVWRFVDEVIRANTTILMGHGSGG